MSVQIEILLITAEGRIRVAYYYPLPPAQYLPDSADPNREPAGAALSAQEIQDLKDGRLVEWIIEVRPPAGATKQQRAQLIEARYAEQQSEAARVYRQRYQFGDIQGAWMDELGEWHLPS